MQSGATLNVVGPDGSKIDDVQVTPSGLLAPGTQNGVSAAADWIFATERLGTARLSARQDGASVVGSVQIADCSGGV